MRRLTTLGEEELMTAAKELGAPYELIRWVAGWRQDVQVLSPTILEQELIKGSAEFLRRAAARLGVAVESLLS